MKAPTLTVFCRCAKGEAELEEPRRGILNALLSAGHPLLVVDDLCGAAARRDAQLRAAVEGRALTVIACQPRAVQWLLQRCEAKPESLEALNALTESAESIGARLRAGSLTGESAQPSRLESNDGWIPWFPVIDYDHCVNCKKCLSFCLFGVYGLNEAGKVSVVNPAGCKTNCPACARVCPKAAIIFPKFPESPINGGPITDKIPATPLKVDLEKALGSNIYDTLAERRKHRSILAKRPNFLDDSPPQG